MSQHPSSGGTPTDAPSRSPTPSHTHRSQHTPSVKEHHTQATPPGRRRASTSSSTSGYSLASLLTRLHPTSPSALSLEGKLRVRATVDCGSDILCPRFSPDGSLVGVALRSGQVKMYTATGSLSHSLPHPNTQPDISRDIKYDLRRPQPAATSLIWIQDGQPDSVLVTYSNGDAIVWNGKKNIGLTMSGCGVDVRAALSGEGQIISYTLDQITLRDPQTLAPVLSWQTSEGGGLVGGSGRVWTVVGRGREVVGGGTGLTWWDGRAGGRVIRRVGGVHIRGHALASHPHASKLLTGSWGGGGDAVQVWDATSGKLTHALHSDATNTAVLSAVWAGKETVAVGGADPNLMRLATLDNTTLGLVRGLKEGVWGLDASPTKPHQVPRLALSTGSSLYLLDILK